MGLCRISHSLPPGITSSLRVISFYWCNDSERTRKGVFMFASWATWLFVVSAWEETVMHVVMIPGGYHTTAYPTNMVMLAIFFVVMSQSGSFSWMISKNSGIFVSAPWTSLKQYTLCLCWNHCRLTLCKPQLLHAKWIVSLSKFGRMCSSEAITE